MYLSFSYLSHTSTDFDENSHDILHFYICTYKKFGIFCTVKIRFFEVQKRAQYARAAKLQKRRDHRGKRPLYIFIEELPFA